MTFEEHVQRALEELPRRTWPRSSTTLWSWSKRRRLASPICSGSGKRPNTMPAKITIFRRPLVETFPDPADLEKEIRITVLHEPAHGFGLDEHRPDQLGYS